jgi:hypothetical protein
MFLILDLQENIYRKVKKTYFPSAGLATSLKTERCRRRPAIGGVWRRGGGGRNPISHQESRHARTWRDVVAWEDLEAVIFLTHYFLSLHRIPAVVGGISGDMGKGLGIKRTDFCNWADRSGGVGGGGGGGGAWGGGRGVGRCVFLSWVLYVGGGGVYFMKFYSNDAKST